MIFFPLLLLLFGTTTSWLPSNRKMLQHIRTTHVPLISSGRWANTNRCTPSYTAFCGSSSDNSDVDDPLQEVQQKIRAVEYCLYNFGNITIPIKENESFRKLVIIYKKFKVEDDLVDMLKNLQGKETKLLPSNTATVVKDDISVLWTPVWTAIVNDRIIENPTNPHLWLLPDGIKWVGDIQELYNRECYDEITENISSLTHALIYGTPGIGKSLYLQVFLVHLARRARAEKLPLPSIQYRYYEGDKVVNLSFLPDGSVVDISNVLQPPLPDYLLSDSVDISVPTGRILNLEVASDKDRNYNNFRKRVQEAKEMGGVFVMPLFRIHELQSIRPKDMDDQCTEFRHDVFGGSARNFNAFKTLSSFDILPVVESSMTLIFSDVKKKQPGVWNAVARQISEMLSQRPTDSQTTVNSMMWHMAPGGSKMWASNFMEFLAGVILESRTSNILDELKRIVVSSGIGFLFEAIGHRKLLMSTGSFLLKPLFKSLPNEQPDFSILKLNGSVIRFKMIEEIGNLPDSAFGLPFTDHFPIADAIIQPDTLIQFTTSPKKHTGSLMNLTDVRAQLHAPYNEHRLIFVIPKENLDTYVYHTELEDIRQFICLPDPSVMVPKSLMNKTERKRWISKK